MSLGSSPISSRNSVPPDASSNRPSFDTTAPVKTPRPIIDRMSREVAAVLAQPDLKARLAAISTDTVGSTPAELAAFIEQEAKVNGDVIRELKISLD